MVSLTPFLYNFALQTEKNIVFFAQYVILMSMKSSKDTITIGHIFFSIYGWFLFLFLFLTNFIILVPIFALLTLFTWDKHKKFFTYLSKFFARSFFFLFFVHTININKKAVKAPKKGEKRIYIINHSSQYDVILMYLLPGPIKTIIKDKWAKRPLIGWLQAFTGNIIIKERTAFTDPARMFENVLNKLNAGIPVVIFPEGTRTMSGKIQKFHKGTFRIALATGADIVPVVFDSWNCIRPGALWIRDVKPAIRILDPIKYESYKHLSPMQLSQVTKSIMINALLELRQDRKRLEKKYYRKLDKFNKIDEEMKDELIQLNKKIESKAISLSKAD